MTDIVVECVLEKKSTNDENRMCRICLSLSNSLIPIFKQDGGERELYEKIQKHVPVNISETDSFPQHVCHECANTIVAWDSLYVLSLKTDEKLKSLIISECKNDCHNDSDDDEYLMPPKKRKPIMETTENLKDDNHLPMEKPLMTNDMIREKNNLEIMKNLIVSNEEENKIKNPPRDLRIETTDRDEKMEDDIFIKKVNDDVKNDNENDYECHHCNKLFKDEKCLCGHIKKLHNLKNKKKKQNPFIIVTFVITGTELEGIWISII